MQGRRRGKSWMTTPQGDTRASYDNFCQPSRPGHRGSQRLLHRLPGADQRRVQHGLVARYASADAGARLQLVTNEATAPEDSVISVCTDNVDGAYAEARELGYEIVHALTTERGVLRRFFVRAPDGNLINITNHRD